MADLPRAPRTTADQLDATTAGDPPGTSTALLAPARADRYVLDVELARGGMGVVYQATDTVFDREVAVKVLQDRFAATPAAARRFATEARVAGQLQHPGIPPVHDLGTLPDGRPFLAMKLIKGDTLDVLLKARRAAADDRGRWVGVFEQVCHAVAYAHSNGVIHRDLKPANVMVGKFNEVQVMDWGLAKLLSARRAGEGDDPEATTGGTVIHPAPDSAGDATQAGIAVGTPAYMPPEQAVGALAQVDRRSDVFGLGAVLAVVLTGHAPYSAPTGEETRVLAARGKTDDCFARLDTCGADPGLVALCKRCLAAEQAERPADAGEVAAAVAGLRAAAEDRARAAELERERAEVRTAEGRKRRRVVTVAGALLIAALAAGVVGTSVGMVRADETRKRAEANETAAKAAQKEAEESYELAREAVVGVAWDVPDVLRQAVFAREAEKQITVLLVETMEKQVALATTRHLPDRAVHRIHLRLGDLLVLQARYDEAQKHYTAALAVSGRVLAAEERAKDRAKVDHAASHGKLGTLGVTRGFGADPEKVFEHFQKAEALCREVATAPTTGEVDPAEAKVLLAAALHDTAAARERRQEYGLAAAGCEAAAALLEVVLKAEPTRATAGAATRLADVRVLLGEAEFKRGRNAEAEAAMRAATTAYDAEVARDGYDLDLRKRAAQANRAAGDLLLFLHRYEEARHFHARDVQLCRGLLRMPEIVAAEADLSYAHYRSGTLALRRGDRDAAQFYYRRCVVLREEMVAAQPNNAESRLALARALARAGDHLGAVAAFEPVRVRQAGTLAVANQQAVVYGLCADALRAGRPLADLPWYDRQAYDQYLDEAFIGLDRAVTDWDWLDIVGLKTDPDFDPLRVDPRFADAVRKVEERLAGRKF
ncbi:MAG: serine/threonine-protein kinase [Gemmataceae bacterium]